MGQYFKVLGLLTGIDGSVGLAVDWWVVFGAVVCPIMAAFIPLVTELLLRFLAADPP